jgi:hypothetical protein
MWSDSTASQLSGTAREASATGCKQPKLCYCDQVYKYVQ